MQKEAKKAEKRNGTENATNGMKTRKAKLTQAKLLLKAKLTRRKTRHMNITKPLPKT